MNKGIIFCGVLIAVGFVAFSTYNYVSKNTTPKVQHYEGQEITTKDQALSAFAQNNAEIKAILDLDDVSPSDLEKIHEISYTLEKAVDFLISEKLASQSKLEAIDEAVQALHYASEDHEKDTVQKWFVKLEMALVDLEDLKPSSETQSAER